MEDYLETILNLNEEKGFVRMIDIGRLMQVKIPSVCGAMNTLANKGLVIHERYGHVKLTLKGKKIAQDVQKRHRVLYRFLTLILKIDKKIAEKDACKIEHVISPETLEKITKFVEFVETFPEHVRPDWLKSFNYFIETGNRL